MATRFVWTVVPSSVRVIGKIAWRLDLDRSIGFPEPPFVLASNHHSFLDPFLLGAAWNRRMRFIGLIDLFGNSRVVDFGLRAFETIPVKRGTVPLGAVRSALDHLAGGGAVGLFPEGTRHWEFDPERVLPGAAWLAARTGVPLVPIAIDGSERVLGVNNRLHRGRIKVTIGPPLHPTGTDRPSVDDLTRKWANWVYDTLR